MKNFVKSFTVGLLLLTLIMLSGCCTKQTASEADLSNQSEQTYAGKVLIAYFSLGEHMELPQGIDAATSASIMYRDGELTGNAGYIAGVIQKHIGGELFSILSDKKYPYDTDKVLAIGREEGIANERPQLVNHVSDMDSYDTVFLVYPTWWYKMPMAVYSFFDEYDFTGKTIYVVCTSSGSGFVKEIDAIKDLEPNATVVKGISLIQDDTPESEDDIVKWLDTLNLKAEN